MMMTEKVVLLCIAIVILQGVGRVEYLNNHSGTVLCIISWPIL